MFIPFILEQENVEGVILKAAVKGLWQSTFENAKLLLST